MKKALTAIAAALVGTSLTASVWSAEPQRDSDQRVRTGGAQSAPSKKEDEVQRQQYVEQAKDGRGAGSDWSGRKDGEGEKSQGKLEHR